MEPTPTQTRRPGELVFNALILLASLILFYSAYGISGFESLSSPGVVPMATTAIMAFAAARILWSSWKKPQISGETVAHDIMPLSILFTIGMIIAYAVLLRPLGFIPTSVLFLFVMIWYLSRRSLAFCAAVSVGTVLLIWVIFRMIFAVLMPQGIFPEGRIVAFITSLF